MLRQTIVALRQHYRPADLPDPARDRHASRAETQRSRPWPVSHTGPLASRVREPQSGYERAPPRYELGKMRANYSEKVMVEGKGLVDCAPNLAWRDLSAHEVANRRFPWPKRAHVRVPGQERFGWEAPGRPGFPDSTVSESTLLLVYFSVPTGSRQRAEVALGRLDPARELVRHRIQLVWVRGVIRNRLQAMLARRNLQPTSGQSWLTQRGQRELHRLALPAAARTLLSLVKIDPWSAVSYSERGHGVMPPEPVAGSRVFRPASVPAAPRRSARGCIGFPRP